MGNKYSPFILKIRDFFILIQKFSEKNVIKIGVIKYLMNILGVVKYKYRVVIVENTI